MIYALDTMTYPKHISLCIIYKLNCCVPNVRTVVRGRRRNTSSTRFSREEVLAMKYGGAVTIVQIGYIEVETDCESEEKAKAE